MQARNKKIIVMEDIKIQHREAKKVTKASRGVLRAFFAVQKQMLALFLALTMVLVNAHGFIAFEAHIVNVTAEIASIDAPIITPEGGEFQNGPVVDIDSFDPDATHVYYKVTPGVNPETADAPACGDGVGGPKASIPTHAITEDSIVKAVACNGDTVDAQSSIFTYQIYDVIDPFGRIRGHKYFDIDKGGDLSAGDYGLSGWQITLMQGTTTIAVTATDQDGYYEFAQLPLGSYEVIESTPDDWQALSSTNVSVTVGANETKTVNFFNYSNILQCPATNVEFPHGLALQVAGNGSEQNDDITLGADVTVNGDVRSNDDIERIGSASNVVINGSATSSDQVDSGISVNSMTLENAGSGDLPNIDIPTWKTNAASGGTVNGSFDFPDNLVGLILGPSEITGSVEFGKSNTATLKGPLYIHGDLTIDDDTVITQDASLADTFTVVIVDGVIRIDKGVQFIGSGTTGSILLVSTAAAQNGDNAAIEILSDNTDLGDAVLYASNGDVRVFSNRTILAAFARHGNDPDTSSNGAIRMGNHVTVAYRELPSIITCGPTQAYEATSHILINEFLPNPVGDDQGAVGDPLDGEWVELFNPTDSVVDVNGWVLYDNNNTHALTISSANTDLGHTIIPPGEHLVVYRNGDGDFALNNSGGDAVRLFSNEIGLGGILVDAHEYTVSAPEDKSFARIPDGSSNWIDPESTPGESNVAFFEPLSSGSVPYTPKTKPKLYIDPVFLPSVTHASEPTSGTQEEESGDVPTDQAKVEEPAVADVPANPEHNSDEGTEPVVTEHVWGTPSTPNDSGAPAPVEEESTEEPVVDEASAETSVVEEDVPVDPTPAVEEVIADPTPTEETPVVEEVVQEQQPEEVVSEPIVEEPVVEETPVVAEVSVPDPVPEAVPPAGEVTE